MRFALLALALAACSSAGVDASPDAAQSPDVLDVVIVDTAIPDAAVDVTPDAPADASGEASADAAPDVATDAGADADAPSDAATDSRTCGASYILECNVQGSVMCVDVQRGRMVGDHIEHCGACDVVCRAGEVCLERRCQSI